MSLSNLGPALINMGYGTPQNTQSMGPLAMLGIGAASSALNYGINRLGVENDRRHQIKLWNMQNEYNSPKAQMARFAEAGLNPNLIYGQGTPGNASSTAKSSDNKPVEFDAMGAIMQSQNLKAIEAQTDNLRAQHDLLTQEKLIKAIDALVRGEDLTEKRTRNEYLADQLGAALSGSQSDAALKNVLSSLNQMEYQFVTENQDLFIKYLQSKYSEQALKNEGQEKLNAIRELERFIKNDMKEWTTTNQAAGFAARIAQIISKL